MQTLNVCANRQWTLIENDIAQVQDVETHHCNVFHPTMPPGDYAIVVLFMHPLGMDIGICSLWSDVTNCMWRVLFYRKMNES